MEPFKSILVDIDATAGAHPAFDRALSVARQCGARLRIVDVVHVPSPALQRLRPRLQMQLVGERRDRLMQIARAAHDVAVDIDVLTGRPAIALIQEVLRAGHDLLIRSHARDLVARSYGAIDMQLFRNCPCPVWAVAPGAPGPSPRILAAVNVDTDDPIEQQLNAKIVELAMLLTRLDRGSLTILHAWTAFAESLIRTHTTDDDVAAYLDGAHEAARRGLQALTAPFGARLAGARVELRQGNPEDVIPTFVVAEGIDLIVMGTVARTGIAGFLIGNTAERLLQRLLCSVLAVKPDGFVSPVQRGR